MARRQPTEAQKEAAALRREKFKEIAQKVSQMSEDERFALVARFGAIVTCEGRALSTHNSCLILTQCPTASMVGGFRQWMDKGRVVRKGEKGLMLWCPAGKGKQGEEAAQETTEGGEGEQKARARFIMGTVFDVSQTEPMQDATAEQYSEIADIIGARNMGTAKQDKEPATCPSLFA